MPKLEEHQLSVIPGFEVYTREKWVGAVLL